MKNFQYYLIAMLAILIGSTYAQTARLQVIHNAADPGAASVDIYLNGTLLLDNFSFREATPYIDAPAGTPINIGVAGPNSTSAADTLKNFNVTLTENETYVAIANGVLDPNSYSANPDGRSTAITLFVKEMARLQLGVDLPDSDLKAIVAFLKTLTGYYKGQLLTDGQELSK